MSNSVINPFITNRLLFLDNPSNFLCVADVHLHERQNYPAAEWQERVYASVFFHQLYLYDTYATYLWYANCKDPKNVRY